MKNGNHVIYSNRHPARVITSLPNGEVRIKFDDPNLIPPKMNVPAQDERPGPLPGVGATGRVSEAVRQRGVPVPYLRRALEGDQGVPVQLLRLPPVRGEEGRFLVKLKELDELCKRQEEHNLEFLMLTLPRLKPPTGRVRTPFGNCEVATWVANTVVFWAPTKKVRAWIEKEKTRET